MQAEADRAVLRDASDETLMARYAAGSSPAFDEIFRRYEPRVFAYFLKRTASPERARDLYQQLFLRLHGARHEYDPSRPFAPWCFRIAYRLLVDDSRRAYRMREVFTPEVDWVSSETPLETLAEREEVALLLEDLSSDERYVLVAFQGEGVAYVEIAARLGKSVAAVRKMASRATHRVRAASVGKAARV